MPELSRRTVLSLLIAAPLAVAGCSAVRPGQEVATETPSGTDAGLPAAAIASGDLSLGQFGPTGSHWPSRTPKMTDRFDASVEVDASWSAIAAGIAQVAASAPKGKARVLVRPGTLSGGGAGSSKTPVMRNVGAVGRPYRVLVMPRDGVGTVTHSDSLRIELVGGVSFVGFWLGSNSIVLSAVQDFAWAWSKGQAFNITSNSSLPTENVELVECVTPDARLIDSDTWAFRTGGQTYEDISMIGCYLAPSYKNDGSGAHCDTLQLSGDEAKKGLTIRDSVIFASTNSAFIPSGGASDILFDHSLVVGGDRMLQRYPLPAGANAFTSGAPAAVNGIGTVDMLSASASTFIGNVRGVWKSVQSSTVSLAEPPKATSGSFTSDTSLAKVDAAWLEARTPMPTDARLKAAWVLRTA